MRTSSFFPFRFIAALALAFHLWPVSGQPASAPPTKPSPSHRIYPYLLNPRGYPGDARRWVKPPDWSTFHHVTQFTSLRGFSVEQGKIVDFRHAIDEYTTRFHLGNVLWPSYPILFATNLSDLATTIRDRGLYLFDIWGYVPGSGPGGYWQQYHAPPESLAMLHHILGDHFLGVDVGEQDGRYIGGYASQMFPTGQNRFRQYLNFQHYFERMGDDLGNRLSALVSLTFGHYLLKEGTYKLIGAETAQGLPNAQVYYAFIRGAGKEYGVPWFGNVSIYNRWGYKNYSRTDPSGQHRFGPEEGTSLSLMKRLLYSQILYNSMIVGFENGWIAGDHLTPIGHIDQAAQAWVRSHGQPGVLYTPVALLLDFYSGWTVPRHLYTGQTYRVWGNLPYGPGDFLTDDLLNLIYPGYANSSYFHDESGFAAPTPYGDIADCLLTDAPAWVLDQYAAIFAAGNWRGGAELRDKLEAYLKQGGHLYITAANLAHLPGGLAGVTADRPAHPATATIALLASGQRLTEPPFRWWPISGPPSAHVLAATKDHHSLVLRVADGRGTLTVFASPDGLPEHPLEPPPYPSRVDQPLARPFPLLGHVRRTLQRALSQQRLFEVSTGLSLITCRRRPGEYTLEIANNNWKPQPLNITSHCGRIISCTEIPIDRSERKAAGYVPRSVDPAGLGTNGPHTIAGGGLRLFDIKVNEKNLTILPLAKPPPAPHGRWLALRNVASLQTAILARPTFFQHYDGVLISWRYLEKRSPRDLERESGWLRRQKIAIAVDASSGINLYPDLRLIDNDPKPYASSMARLTRLIGKMPALGAHTLLLSLHRYPENNFSAKQAHAAFVATLKKLAAAAQEKGVTLLLRLLAHKPPGNGSAAERLLNEVDASNLELAPSTAWIWQHRGEFTATHSSLAGKIGVWCLDGVQKDWNGQVWNSNAPISGNPVSKDLKSWIALAPKAPLIFDAVYPDQDAEYRDVHWVEQHLADAQPSR